MVTCRNEKVGIAAVARCYRSLLFDLCTSLSRSRPQHGVNADNHLGQFRRPAGAGMEILARRLTVDRWLATVGTAVL